MNDVTAGNGAPIVAFSKDRTTRLELLRKHFLNRTDRLAFKPSWSGDVCPVEGNENLEAMLQAHLTGEKVKVRWITKNGNDGYETGPLRLGTYSPTTDGKTLFAALDCDGGARHPSPLADPLDAAVKILDRCRQLSLTAYLEQSGGGKGWHIWLFLESLINAAKVRRLALGAIPSGLLMADGSLADPAKNKGIEIFPKQATIQADGLGNMIWLPWWHLASEGANQFHELDDQGELKPYIPTGFETACESDVDEALKALGQNKPSPKPSPRHTSPAVCFDERVPSWILLDRALKRTTAGQNGTGRNDTGLWLACQLRDNGYSKEETKNVVLEYQAGVSQEPHPYTQAQAAASSDSAFSRPSRAPWKSAKGPRFTFGAPETAQPKGKAPTQSDPEPVGLATTCLNEILPVPIEWLVPGHLPLGKLVLIAGDGGHGKSALTLDLAACLTTGRPCFGLDYEPLPPSDVLLISCEDDYADTVVPRLLSAGANLDRIRRVDGIRTKEGKLAPFSLAHFQQMEVELEARPNIRLVIIDPAGAYAGRSGVDDYNDSQLRSLLGPMAEMAARQGVTVGLVKHLVKGATAKAVHKVGGSAGYVNTVRAAFVVTPASEEPAKKLFLPLKFNLGPKPGGLAYKTRSLDGLEAGKILDHYGKHLNPEDRDRLAQQLFRIEWLGSVDADADEVMGSCRQEDPNKVERCMEFLEQFLAKYAFPSDEILAAAEKAGFTLDNVKKAKALLKGRGLHNSNQGRFGGTWWSGIGPREKWVLRPESPHTPDYPDYHHNHHNGEIAASKNTAGDTPHNDAALTPQGVRYEKAPVVGIVGIVGSPGTEEGLI